MTNKRTRPEQYPSQSATLASDASTVPAARQMVREACAAWGMDQDAVETGTLLISEIVTNAVHHGHSHSVRVIAERPRPDRLRVAVVDRSRRMPELQRVEPDASGGRGLLLVETLSDSWGTDLLPWGKRVWAEVAVKVGEQ
ncbi:ATP-binding protein [Streptomyces sp. NPDC057798]|uniref:ATP-binding protein n=1 Tax=Streptomyces sp. NPDC057798 TaxID=3346252 RepID=UPI0036AAAB86